jgi:hypothetical protein
MKPGTNYNEIAKMLLLKLHDDTRCTSIINIRLCLRKTAGVDVRGKRLPSHNQQLGALLNHIETALQSYVI